MPEYLYLINNTYTNTSNRNAARDAIQAVLDANPSVIPFESNIAAGLNIQAGTGLTLSVKVPDSFNIEAFRDAMNPAWTAGLRSVTYVSVVKVSD